MMNDQFKMTNAFWACPSVGQSAISFARVSQKDAATIPHVNERVVV